MSVSLNTIEKKIGKSKDITQKTLDKYMKSLETLLLRYLDVNPRPKFSLSVFYDFKTVKEKLDKVKPGSRVGFIVPIILTLRQYASARKKEIKINGAKKSVIEAYSNYLSATNREIEDRYDTHKLTKDEKDNWIDFKDVIKLREKKKKDIKIDFNTLKKLSPQKREEYVNKNYKAKDIDKVQQWVVLSYYTYLPPQRNDAATLIMVRPGSKNPKNSNYLSIDDKVVVLKYYKTRRARERKQKREGTNENLDVVIELPPELINVIKQWMLVNPTDFFLINTTSHTQMSKNGLTRYMNKIFSPKKVSTSLLRKSMWHHAFPMLHDPVKMKELAYKMVHNLDTVQQVYRKRIEQGGGGFGDYAP